MRQLLGVLCTQFFRNGERVSLLEIIDEFTLPILPAPIDFESYFEVEMPGELEPLERTARIDVVGPDGVVIGHTDDLRVQPKQWEGRAAVMSFHVSCTVDVRAAGPHEIRLVIEETVVAWREFSVFERGKRPVELSDR